MRNLRLFGLLLWKNFIIQKRKVVVTIFQILVPTIFAVILILFRERIYSHRHDNGMNWTEFSVNSLPEDLVWDFPKFTPKVAFTPNLPVTQKIMADVERQLKISTTGIGHGMTQEHEMVDFLMFSNATLNNTKIYLGGVVFYNMDTINNTIPMNISYKIRLSGIPRNAKHKQHVPPNPFADSSSWKTDRMFPFFAKPEPRELWNKYGGSNPGMLEPSPYARSHGDERRRRMSSTWGIELSSPAGYQEEGFLALQHAINWATIRTLIPPDTTDFERMEVLMRRHPYPPFNNDNFISVIQNQFPQIILLSFVLCALSIVKDVTHEKEKRLKESMKMMGISNWLHWSAWFTKYFTYMLIDVIIMTVLFTTPIAKYGAVIRYTNPVIMFLFLLIYSISVIAYCFMVSAFFDKANSAAAAGGVFFFIIYIPYFFIQPRYDTLSHPVKMVVSLMFNVAMPFGCQIIGMFEGTGAGVQWYNLANGVSCDDDFALLHVMIMLLLDSLLYFLVTWYVEAVWPGEYGIPLHWYFPFQKSYWCGNNPYEYIYDEERLLLDNTVTQSTESFERDPIGLDPGIRILKLTKVYKTQKNVPPAVSKMSLKMFKGQITALLGHNGAGKTTTMSMLTGFIPPTSGTAIVNGFNIMTDISRVRESLGLCPQHDVLFDSLTVEEHLKFFALAKGYPRDDLPGEIDRILNDIDLDNKRHSQSNKLSGGMKRKLSIGIALIADSKIVILDEPTSGMDPSARRYIWSVLQRYRHDRTIVLSTHFMDEADLLGDRIAIMANGEVQCCGSSLFLKNKYGAGYHMVMVKTSACEVNKISELIESYVPSSKLESNVGLELTYVLPHASSDRFEELFTEIEQRKSHLGISSYGASVTTLEEVFLKVGEVTDGGLKEKIKKMGRRFKEGSESYSYDGTGSSYMDEAAYSTVNLCNHDENKRVSDTKLHLLQFYAMFVKRVLHTRRNVILTLTQLAVPVIFALAALIVIKTFPGGEDSPALRLSLQKFGHTVVPYSHQKSVTRPVIELTRVYGNDLNTSYVDPVKVNHLKRYAKDPSVYDFLFTQGKRSVATYNRKFMVAAKFSNESDNSIVARAFFNNNAFHSIAMSLGLLDNAILRYFTNKTYWFEAINHPLPLLATTQTSSRVNLLIGFSVAFDLLFGIAVLASSFSFFLIKERSVKAKHIQEVSGVNPLNFWLSTFAWDLINYIVPCILVIIFFAVFQIKAYIIGNHGFHLMLVFFLYGWAMLPFMYLFSFLFTVPATGRVWITIFNIITGLLTMLVVTILKLPTLGTEDVGKALEWAFTVLMPNFCLGGAIQNYYYNYEYITVCHAMIPNLEQFCKMIGNTTSIPCCIETCTKDCLDFNYNYLGWRGLGIGRMLVFLAIQGAIFFAILFLVESGLLQRMFYALRPNRVSLIRQISDSLVKIDEDITAEKFRITHTPNQDLFPTDAIVMEHLTKVYGDFTAVDNMTLGVGKGECFGLLGVNGAGKTTTFKMLTGDEIITSGNAFMWGHSIRTDIKNVQKVLGYCPQYDALIDQMTGREMLTMFARLRGVRPNQTRVAVHELIQSLHFAEHADKLVKYYSGGNKRKLSTALALIGDPPIVFLDEPSTGMDPVARRLLWNTLSSVLEQGRTLILTSHSMEECEALCTRIAIMVNGQLKCLGSPQHLKSKFGEGFTLIAKVMYPANGGEPNLQPLMHYIEHTFHNSQLKDIHEGMVHYHIMDPELSWATIFGTMERAKKRFDIEDYSVSQTTLEQVFINFVRSQRPPLEIENKSCQRCRLMCGSCCCCCTPLTYVEVVE